MPTPIPSSLFVINSPGNGLLHGYTNDDAPMVLAWKSRNKAKKYADKLQTPGLQIVRPKERDLRAAAMQLVEGGAQKVFLTLQPSGPSWMLSSILDEEYGVNQGITPGGPLGFISLAAADA